VRPQGTPLWHWVAELAQPPAARSPKEDSCDRERSDVCPEGCAEILVQRVGGSPMGHGIPFATVGSTLAP